MDFLDTMADHSRERAARARQVTSLASIRDEARARPPAPSLRLSATGFDLIAELKLRAPSAGVLSAPLGEEAMVSRALQYAAAGAAAISVLTEDSRFDGSLDHLRLVADALDQVPVMRKDFLVDPYQVYEARAAGAGGVLLIARMLDDAALASMLAAARDCGLFALLEAFDAQDLARIARLDLGDDTLVGVNCRDLASLGIDFGRFAALIDAFPAGVASVAESGMVSPQDVAAVAQAGYRLALVGTALMRVDTPGELLSRMLIAGRSH